MRIAWATDLHLDFVSEAMVVALCERIEAATPDAVLIGGDIADALKLPDTLRLLDRHLRAAAFFVLGNHDYYGGDVQGVRDAARAAQTETMRWLPATGPITLRPGLGLVGHGGWGDARLGDFVGSGLALNDYFAIRDLRLVGADPADPKPDPLSGWRHREPLQSRLRSLGDDAARTLRPHLEAALRTHDDVLVLTHVPPFREACWYQGRISGEDGLPGFTCQAIGDLLLEQAETHADRRIRVLCGHTHDGGEATLRPNLHVTTGEARYERPDFVVLEM